MAQHLRGLIDADPVGFAQAKLKVSDVVKRLGQQKAVFEWMPRHVALLTLSALTPRVSSTVASCSVGKEGEARSCWGEEFDGHLRLRLVWRP